MRSVCVQRVLVLVARVSLAATRSMMSSGSGEEDDDQQPEQPASLLSKDQVLSLYVESAKKMRRRTSTLLGRPKKKRARVNTPQPVTSTEGQLWICIAKMTYDAVKGKGVQARGSTGRKIFINKEADYSNVLERVREELYGPSCGEGLEYYLSDASGLPITKDGNIVLHNRDGSSETHVWTLTSWLNISGIRYQSRAKLFCVEKSTQDDPECSDLDDNSGGDSKPSNETEVADDKHKAETVTCVDTDTAGTTADIPHGVNVAYKEFEPLFASFTKSCYADKYVLKADMKLSRVCVHVLELTPYDLEFDVDPSRCVNPCSLDFLFHGVRTGETLSFIQDFDMEQGRLLFGTPCEGAEFVYWSAGCAKCGVAILICIALNAYHPMTTYKWYESDRRIESNPYPILYTSRSGEYRCVMEVGDDEKIHKFSVLGNDDNVPQEVMTDPSPTLKALSHAFVIPKQSKPTCNIILNDQKYMTNANDHLAPQHALQMIGQDIIAVESSIVSTLRPQVACNWQELTELTDSELGGTFDELKLIEVVGEGTFGIVHKAIWRGTIVAAKLINVPSGSEASVKKEIELCRRVQHPNILCVLGSILKKQKIAIISNLVRGNNLHNLLFCNSTKLSFSLKKSIAVQVAQGLSFLHTSSPPLVHLDIKPANILVESGTSHAYIADFGVAKVLNQGTLATSSTNSSSSSIGTPGFQPIEQLKAGKIHVTVDVYAFGCVLIELFGGKKVWEGLSAIQIMVKVAVESAVPDYSHLPESVKPICAKCLQGQENRAPANVVLFSLLSL